ncbi:hypothetical protein SAMN06309944_1088 [Micrococcales bacterium KH10]|nr:hypothetical protein SAMN06309944_1088 [Micrococcales bacterium KH10]
MDIELFGSAFAVVTLTLGLLVTGLLIQRKRRGLARGPLGGAGVIGLITAVAISLFVWNLYADETTVAISGKHDNHFNFDIRHTRVSMDGVEYRFRPRVSEQELRQEFTAQYPHGDVDGDRLSVILDGLRFIVEPDDEEGVWAACRQTVTLIDQGAHFANISFPTGIVKDDQLRFDEPASLLVDRQEVFDELALLGTPVAEDGTVFVGTVNQGVLHMTFTEDTVTVNRL